MEGIPTTNDPPDVTFMLGASMDPPVETNPFLVIFSPLERVTTGIRMRPGTLKPAPDGSVVFMWDIWGYPSEWRLDRRTQELRPVTPAGTSAVLQWTTSFMPALTAIAGGRKTTD